jgi:hypothetical protein
VNYSAIADRATEIIGSADPAQFQTAFDAMVSETESTVLTENFESELAVISRLGISEGVTVLETIKAAALQQLGVDTLTRLIESERGVNLADPQTIAFVGALVTGGALTQAQADALLSSNTVTEPKWPGLKAGIVQDALRQRVGGEV